MQGDLFLLVNCGYDLDFRPHWEHLFPRGSDENPYLVAPTLRDWLISRCLKIRTVEGRRVLLHLNRAQAEYSRTCSRRNIVLKARQLGITTYIAARFFIETIMRPGTLTVQIAHNISGVATAAQDTTKGAADTQTAARALSEMAAELQNLVGRFRF